VVGIVHLHLHTHAGVTGANFRQQRRHHGGSRKRPHAKRQVTHLALTVQADVTLQATAVKNELACPLHHKGASVGARGFHRAAVKQLQAQFVFGRLNAAAKCRLGQMALRGGTAKVARIGQGHQVFESLQVHCAGFAV
jgi:hypothetical protein